MMQASSARRFLNFFIDGLLIRLIGERLLIYDSFPLGIQLDNLGLLLGFGLLVTFLYYMIFESLFQRTPAKLITRTKVVDADTGSRPTFSAIVKRTIFQLVA